MISTKEKEFMKSFVDESKLFTVSNVHNLKVRPEEMPSFENGMEYSLLERSYMTLMWMQ